MKPKLIIFDTGIIDNINTRLLQLLSNKFDCKLYYLYKDYRKFENSFFVKKIFLILLEFIKISFLLLINKPNKIIIRGGSLNYYFYIPFLVKILVRNNEIILFKYDIDNFREYSNSFYANIFLYFNKVSEKINMIYSDKIIHKGLKNELEFLPFYEKIKNKKHYLFREFIDEDLICDYNPNVKLSKKDGEIHLCYGGCIHERDNFYHERTVNLFKKIAEQKIHIHVYARKSKDFEILKDNKYFHYEGFFTYSELLKEYTKYDFGVYLYGRTDNLFYDDNIWNLTGFSNKIFDYILAGLPILYSSNLIAISEFLDTKRLGIKLDYRNLDFSMLNNFALDEFIKDRNKYLNNYDNSRFIKFMEE